MPITVATWNVNSIRVREAAVCEWLERRQPDVLCLQETKIVDEDFPRQGFEQLGYTLTLFGQRTYNGVALLSRHPLRGVRTGFPSDSPDAQRRAIAATTAGLQVLNLYVPNGEDLGTEKFAYKLRWLESLETYLACGFDPQLPLLVCGDFNITPDDRDVHDPEKLRGKILCSEPEREALRRLFARGFRDSFRLHHEDGGHYSWWDYRMNAFRRKLGLRIDLILTDAALSERCIATEIDTDPRRGERPSDHAPVLATFRD